MLRFFYCMNNTAIINIYVRNFPPANPRYAFLSFITYSANLNPFISLFTVFLSVVYKVM